MIFRRLCFHLYLAGVSLCLFLPWGLVARIAQHVRDLSRRRSASYFTDAAEPQPKSGPYDRIRRYSATGFWVLLVLAPCYLLNRSSRPELLHPRTRPFRATPNQAAAVATSQFVGNARTVSSVAEQHGSRYLFALQPHLMHSGPATDDDRVFCEALNSISFWGFPLGAFISAYYSNLIAICKRDDRLSGEFLDLTNLFADEPEQRFIDTVHLGGIGQAECAERLAEAIIAQCRDDHAD